LMMPMNLPLEKILVQVFWFSVLHLFLLTIGMIDFDRQSLKPRGMIFFLAPILIFGVFFQVHSSLFDPLLGLMVALILGFLTTKIIRVNDRILWIFALLALGGFLGWQKAIIILLVALPCYAAIVFVTRCSCAVLVLALVAFLVNVWFLVRDSMSLTIW